MAAVNGKADSRILLAEIRVYPLKGGQGFQPPVWPLEATGLLMDRRWMVIDSDGQSITQRSNRRLTLIQTVMDSEELVFTAPGVGAVRSPIDLAPGRLVKAWMEGAEEVWVSPVGAGLDEWFSTALGVECRLVHRSEDSDRWVNQRPDQGRPLNFHNAFPLHLVSQASLDDLNLRLVTPVSMDRFRPNLTVLGTDPHEDDCWKRIQIGETILRIGRACDHRCGVPNIDQETGQRGVEPLKTLATYRRSSKGIYFGQNVVVEHGGELRVGAPVIVLERMKG